MSISEKFEYRPQRCSSLTPSQIREAMVLHEAGWSNVAIGKKLGRHNSNIQRLLTKMSSESVIKDMETTKSKTNVKARRVTGHQAPEESPLSGVEVQPGQPLPEAAGELEALRKKVRMLETALSDAITERDLFKEIIDVAETKFDIRIRKKAGARQ